MEVGDAASQNGGSLVLVLVLGFSPLPHSSVPRTGSKFDMN